MSEKRIEQKPGGRMTILIAVGLWSVVVALTLRFIKYVHDCDEQIKNLTQNK